jgi:malate dehydrogenase (oxaloacetate-decarboxylating)(NADP+)
MMLPHGAALLRDPSLNKGTAFTAAERDALGLRGLLPHHVNTQAEQVTRVLENFRRKPSDLEKYIDLNALHDRNETLFFRVLADHLEEMMPIVYTPTVGLACQQYAHIFQRSRGVFISATDRGRVEEALRNWPEPGVRMIVVTDGERILGLGDLGANGMAIPIGKLALYTAAAGIEPTDCLPVVLDVGTNNDALLNDPLYIGLHQRRLTGADYDALVDEFVAAAERVFPGVIIQFEDFANHNAFRLLRKYQDQICTFNDDIQGTAAVALAGLFSALRVTGGTLADQRLLFLGAGEAATGIADLTVAAMMAAGLPEGDARRGCWLVDSRGLVVRTRTGLAEHKQPYAHDHAPVADFLSAIRALKPTAIIGVAAQGGAFTRAVVEEMARLNERPVIFALSNPTSKSECTAAQAFEWSGGRSLFASGSPFEPVTVEGRAFVPRQGNNCYVFPGVGLGVIAGGARRITNEMFMAAARALAGCVSQADIDQGSLYPPLSSVRQISARIAAAVAAVAYAQGHATTPRPDDLLAFMGSKMYEPTYPVYVKEPRPAR